MTEPLHPVGARSSADETDVQRAEAWLNLMPDQATLDAAWDALPDNIEILLGGSS